MSLSDSAYEAWDRASVIFVVICGLALVLVEPIDDWLEDWKERRRRANVEAWMKERGER